MTNYKSVDVTEKQLEELIRQNSHNIEDGLKYIDHQRNTDRGPLDIIMVDSGNTLVVAELKVVEDDTMLVQSIDYYDFLSRNIEGMARVYKKFNIDIKQKIRILLIAPSFSSTLKNRIKWVDIPITLCTYKCIKLEGSNEIIPVFNEETLQSLPQLIESYDIKDRLNYITDKKARNILNEFMKEMHEWDKTNILIEPTKYDISLKITGRVFGYIGPRRNYFIIYTYDNEDKWTGYPVHNPDDLNEIRTLLKLNIDKYRNK